MAKKKLKTEVRRRQIAKACLRIIGAHGVKGLSIARVASAVGIAPSNIYRHFKGKEEVIGEALEYIRARLRKNIETARNETGPASERLMGVLRRHAAMAGEIRNLPLLLFSEEVFLGAPALKRKLQAGLREYIGALVGLVAEGQENGEIRRDIGPETLAMVGFGAVMPAAILWHLSGKTFDLDAQAETHLRVLDEILASPGKRGGRKSGARRRSRKAGTARAAGRSR